MSDDCKNCTNCVCDKRIPDFGPKANQAILDAIISFPKVFEIRTYQGTFHINRDQSYVLDGKVILYLEIKCDGMWYGFGASTLSDLRKNIVRTTKEFVCIKHYFEVANVKR